jgi:hypothetical protein
VCNPAARTLAAAGWKIDTRKEAQGIGDDHVPCACAAHARLIKQKHIQADGNRRIRRNPRCG